MMKNIILLIALLLIAGCAHQAPGQTYRPVNSAEMWTITGTYIEGPEKLTIVVNGQTAITGKLSMFSGSGELRGKYKQYNMNASCNTKSDWMGNQKVTCFVFVGNERAATLQF